MPTFDRLNYALRPNKNVERKLIADVLHRLEQRFPIRDYRYVGMGSLWFEDFRVLHRMFGMEDMVSIEKFAADRARFNCPFDCVAVEEGETTMVLPKLDLRAKRALVWLDHEKDLAGPALADLAFATERVPSGSIVAVTVNAHHANIKNRKDPVGNDVSPEDALKEDAGALIPPELKADDLNRRGFPTTVSRILRSAFRHALIKAGRDESFVVLFNFVYEDGVPMVTVGGMVASADERDRLAEVNWRNAAYVPEKNGDEPFRIDVPNLTLKEKAALDQCIPLGGELTTELVKHRYDFALDTSKLQAYRRFYRQYPAFVEFVS